MYSVLVPARNGARYIGHAIRSVLDQDRPDVELIVSVDRSTDGTLDVVREFEDPRLTILEPPRPLSMAGHYEWCLDHARGRWLTILGQDDAVMPYFFEAADDVLDRWPGAQAVSSRRAYYFWPGCEPLYGRDVVVYVPGAEERMMSSSLQLLRALAGISQHFDLPQIYTNNLVRAELVERITKLSGGRFYHEMTPDVYSGVAISLATSRFLRVELPLFWTGTSPESTGFAISMQSSSPVRTEDLEVRGHFERARADALGIAEEVGEGLWHAGESSILYVLSALRRVPFRARWWSGRWVLYLAYGALPSDVRGRWTGDDASFRSFERQYSQQVSRLGLNRVVLRLVASAIALLRAGRWLMRALKRVRRTLAHGQGHERPDHIVSEDRATFPDVTAASGAVARSKAGPQVRDAP